MKAIVVRQTGGPEALRLETVPDPVPGPREALIEVGACGVCSLDVVTRNGTYRRNVELPLIPGHEIAGRIVQVGSEVRRFRVGDRVATTQRSHICGSCRHCRSGGETLCEERRFLGQQRMVGGYAQYAAVEDDNLALVPDGVSTEQAAIAGCAIGTGLNAVRDTGRVRLGERVLVTGAAGGVGIHALQIARASGAFVIAQTTSQQKAQALAHYADAVVVHARGEDFSPQVRALTAGAGADVIIDNVGTPLFEPMRRSLAVNGRWILVGQVTDGFVPFNPAQLFLRNQSMLSVHSTTRVQLEDTLQLIARGVVTPVIAGVERLEDVAAVQARVERGDVCGRILVRPPAPGA